MKVVVYSVVFTINTSITKSSSLRKLYEFQYTLQYFFHIQDPLESYMAIAFFGINYL